eukprot:UN14084
MCYFGKHAYHQISRHHYPIYQHLSSTESLNLRSAIAIIS